MVVLGGGAVSYERGTPVPRRKLKHCKEHAWIVKSATTHWKKKLFRERFKLEVFRGLGTVDNMRREGGVHNLKGFNDVHTENCSIQGQNLVLTGLFVPSSLESSKCSLQS